MDVIGYRYLLSVCRPIIGASTFPIGIKEYSEPIKISSTVHYQPDILSGFSYSIPSKFAVTFLLGGPRLRELIIPVYIETSMVI